MQDTSIILSQGSGSTRAKLASVNVLRRGKLVVEGERRADAVGRPAWETLKIPDGHARHVGIVPGQATNVWLTLAMTDAKRIKQTRRD